MTITATKKPVIGFLPAMLPSAKPAFAEFVGIADPKALADVDGVVIAGEVDQHRRLVQTAAEAGVRAILCESPLATTLAGARALVDACERRDVRLALAFPCRYSPAFKRLREQVRAGAVGDVVAIRATSHGPIAEEQKSAGVLLDRAAQLVDLSRWLLGREASEVYAETANRFYDGSGEDSALLSIKFADTFATVDARWSHSKSYPAAGEVTLQVVGTGGVLDLDMFSQGLALSSAKDGRISWPGWGSDIAVGMISDFARLVAGEPAPNLATGEDGLRALEVAFAAHRSAEREEPVSVG
ncbi:MAG TPA: Gfo/Idh/MocA family oxidoreductase [Capsulimonadaceae bacterium]|nr:Gfo/Idh/MocA family oxidoreductase [Capsulimonadaceae bacterium]